MNEDKPPHEKNINNYTNELKIEKINLKDIIIGQKLCKCNYGYIALGKKKKKLMHYIQ